MDISEAMFYMNQNSNNKNITCIINYRETGKENQNFLVFIDIF